MQYKRMVGFTLIEVIMVMALILILMAITLVAVNPLKMFANSRDAKRAVEANQILNAIHQCIVDKKNENNCMIGLTKGDTYEITTESVASGCKTVCGKVTTESHCINMSASLMDYFEKLPIDPNIEMPGHTGYSLTYYNNGMAVIEACLAENSEIKVSR